MELLSTHAAGAVGSPTVGLSVFPQESVAVEGVATNPAAEYPSGGPLVGLAFHLGALTSLSLLTLVSFILFVAGQVLQKKLIFMESQPADWTRPLAAVDLPVAPQRSGPREALPTDAAAVRFLSGVTPHVRLHVLEGLPTDVTRPSAFSVRLQMVEELERGLARLAAHAAQALWVCFHVIQQSLLAAEASATAEAVVSCCLHLLPCNI